MSNTIVFRVEHLTIPCENNPSFVNRGAYRVSYEITAMFSDEERHPSPRHDPKLQKRWMHLYQNDLEEDYVFGFSSLDDLKRWFDTDVILNTDFGLCVRVYQTNIDTTYCGSFQTIFKASDSKRLTTLDNSVLIN